MSSITSCEESILKCLPLSQDLLNHEGTIPPPSISVGHSLEVVGQADYDRMLAVSLGVNDPGQSWCSSLATPTPISQTLPTTTDDLQQDMLKKETRASRALFSDSCPETLLMRHGSVCDHDPSTSRGSISCDHDLNTSCGSVSCDHDPSTSRGSVSRDHNLNTSYRTITASPKCNGSPTLSETNIEDALSIFFSPPESSNSKRKRKHAPPSRNRKRKLTHIKSNLISPDHRVSELNSTTFSDTSDVSHSDMSHSDVSHSEVSHSDVSNSVCDSTMKIRSILSSRCKDRLKCCKSVSFSLDHVVISDSSDVTLCGTDLVADEKMDETGKNSSTDSNCIQNSIIPDNVAPRIDPTSAVQQKCYENVYGSERTIVDFNESNSCTRDEVVGESKQSSDIPNIIFNGEVNGGHRDSEKTSGDCDHIGSDSGHNDDDLFSQISPTVLQSMVDISDVTGETEDRWVTKAPGCDQQHCRQKIKSLNDCHIVDTKSCASELCDSSVASIPGLELSNSSTIDATVASSVVRELLSSDNPKDLLIGNTKDLSSKSICNDKILTISNQKEDYQATSVSSRRHKKKSFLYPTFIQIEKTLPDQVFRLRSVTNADDKTCKESSLQPLLIHNETNHGARSCDTECVNEAPVRENRPTLKPNQVIQKFSDIFRINENVKNTSTASQEPNHSSPRNSHTTFKKSSPKSSPKPVVNTPRQFDHGDGESLTNQCNPKKNCVEGHDTVCEGLADHATVGGGGVTIGAGFILYSNDESVSRDLRTREVELADKVLPHMMCLEMFKNNNYVKTEESSYDTNIGTLFADSEMPEYEGNYCEIAKESECNTNSEQSSSQMSGKDEVDLITNRTYFNEKSKMAVSDYVDKESSKQEKDGKTTESMFIVKVFPAESGRCREIPMTETRELQLKCLDGEVGVSSGEVETLCEDTHDSRRVSSTNIESRRQVNTCDIDQLDIDQNISKCRQNQLVNCDDIHSENVSNYKFDEVPEFAFASGRKFDVDMETVSKYRMVLNLDGDISENESEFGDLKSGNIENIYTNRTKQCDEDTRGNNVASNNTIDKSINYVTASNTMVYSDICQNICNDQNLYHEKNTRQQDPVRGSYDTTGQKRKSSDDGAKGHQAFKAPRQLKSVTTAGSNSENEDDGCKKSSMNSSVTVGVYSKRNSDRKDCSDEITRRDVINKTGSLSEDFDSSIPDEELCAELTCLSCEYKVEEDKLKGTINYIKNYVKSPSVNNCDTQRVSIESKREIDKENYDGCYATNDVVHTGLDAMSDNLLLNASKNDVHINENSLKSGNKLLSKSSMIYSSSRSKVSEGNVYTYPTKYTKDNNLGLSATGNPNRVLTQTKAFSDDITGGDSNQTNYTSVGEKIHIRDHEGNIIDNGFQHSRNSIGNNLARVYQMIGGNAICFADDSFDENNSKPTKPSVDESYSSIFKTASGNNVGVSEKSLDETRKLFAEDPLNEYNSKPTKPSVDQSYSSIFKTASGNNVGVSEKSLEKTNQLFAEDPLNEYNSKPTKPSVDQSYSSIFKTASGNNVGVSEKSLDETRKLFAEDPLNEYNSKPTKPSVDQSYSSIFKTASGNNVGVSEKSLDETRKLFAEDPLNEYNSKPTKPSVDQSYSSIFKTASGNNVGVSEKSLEKTNQLFAEDQLNEYNSKPTKPSVDESYSSIFKTASGNNVGVSEKSLDETRKLFAEDQLNEYNSKPTKPSVDQSYSSIFKTASGNNVGVSEKSLDETRKLFAEDQLNEYNSKPTKPSVDESYSSIFKTASGNNVGVSEKSLDETRKLFAEDQLNEYNSKPTKPSVDESYSSIFKTASGNNVGVSEKSLDATRKLFAEDQLNEYNSKPTKPSVDESYSSIFKTASGNNVGVSEKSLDETRKLFAEDPFSENNVNDKAVPQKYETEKDVGETTNALNDEGGVSPLINVNEGGEFHEITINDSTFKDHDSVTKDEVMKNNANLSRIISNLTLAETKAYPGDCKQTGIAGHITPTRRPLSTRSELSINDRLLHPLVPGVNIIRQEHDTKQSPKMNSSDNICANVSPSGASDLCSGLVKGILSVLEQARFKQDRIILEKREGKITVRTSPGRLMQAKTRVPRVRGLKLKKARMRESESGYSNAQLWSHGMDDLPVNLGDQEPPIGNHSTGQQVISIIHLMGVEHSTLSVTSLTAMTFTFDLRHLYGARVESEGVIVGDSVTLVPDDSGLAGNSQFYRALCTHPSVDPNLIDERWVANHYRWIVWKLAAYERVLPSQFATRSLTPDNVMAQLKYRYDREVDLAQRSCIRKVTEHDDSAGKRMVLFVSRIVYPTTLTDALVEQTDKEKTSLQASPMPRIELCDGWYSLPACVDPPLTHLLVSGAIGVGDKLCVHGAELVGLTDPCPPLDVPGSAMLKIHMNSTRRARWAARLGYQPHPSPMPLSLSGVHGSGGIVGCVDVVILRVYPELYMEKTTERGCVFRNGRAERRAADEYSRQRETEIEKMYNRISQDVQAKNADKRRQSMRTQALRRKCIESLETGRELYEAMSGSMEPEAIHEYLSSEQRRMLADYQQEVTERERNRIETEIRKMMDTSSTALPARNVTSMRKFRIAGCAARDIDARTTNLLTVWRPDEALNEVLCEGSCMRISALSASLSRSPLSQGTVQLSTTKHTRYQRLDFDENLLDLIYQPRETLLVREIPRHVSAFRELDFVGVVLRILPTNHGSGEMVYAADLCGDILAIRFWEGLKAMSVDACLAVDQAFSATNLRLKLTRPLPIVTVDVSPEFTTFSQSGSGAVTEKLRRTKCLLKEAFFVASHTKLDEMLGRVTPPRTQSPMQQHPDPFTHNKTSLKRECDSSFTQGMATTVPQPLHAQKLSNDIKRNKLLQYGSPPPLAPLASPIPGPVRKTFLPPRKLSRGAPNN